jgi:hypothetical protein
MNGYDTYDYGARGYYPAMGRFTSVDPLAERKPWMSPYAYCSGNPVNRIDPDGKFDIPKWDKEFQKITNAASNANSNLVGIASAKVSVSVSAYSVGGSVNVAGAKLGAKVEVANATGAVSTQGASLGVSLFKVEGNASLSNTSAKVGMSIGNATANIDSKSNVTTEVKATNASAKIETGNNQVNTNFQSVGVGVKFGPIVANVELNVAKLTNYVAGVANFVGTLISAKLSEYLPNISQKEILNGR